MADILDKSANVCREQVWLSAWLAVARAEGCRDAGIAASWADKCLAAFDERFPTDDAARGFAPREAE